MNYVQISHPALVALQGRLRGIAVGLQRFRDLGRPANNVRDDRDRANHILHDVAEAIAEIDDWLTRADMQVPRDQVPEGRTVQGGGDHGD